jgi:hypothetical protein
MIGILDEADPSGEVYDPAGIDIIDNDYGLREVIK